MGVTPGDMLVDESLGRQFQGNSFLLSLNITCGNIHTSDITHLTVDDTDLTVITVVYLSGKGRELHRHEGMHLYTLITHTFEEGTVYTPATYRIVDHAYLNTLFCLCDQRVGHHISQGIIIKNIRIQMDMMFGLSYIPQESMKEMIAVGIDIHMVILERECPVLCGEQFDQRVVFLWQMKILLFGELQHGTFSQLIHTVLRDHLLLAGVLSEEEIEDKTYHWQEDQHQHPCHGLGRLPVVEQHHQYAGNNDHHIHEEDEPVNIYHL